MANFAPSTYVTIRRSDIAENMGRQNIYLLDHQKVGTTNFRKVARAQVGSVITFGKFLYEVESVELKETDEAFKGIWLNYIEIVVKKVGRR